MKRLPLSARFAFGFLALLVLTAVFKDLLANGRPLYCKLRGKHYFIGLHALTGRAGGPYGVPLLDSLEINQLWKYTQYEASVFAPIPFSADEFSRKTPFLRQPPLRVHPGYSGVYRHWLGTDDGGRDVAAILLAGARTAVLTGLVAMSLAFSLGLLLGAPAGFFGDTDFFIRKNRLYALLLALPVACFYGFVVDWPFLSDYPGAWIIRILLFVVFFILFELLSGLLPFGRAKVVLPVDFIVMRTAEVFNSVPTLVAILTLAVLIGRESQTALIAAIGAMGWPGVAVYVRSEMLRVRNLEYMQAARGLAFSNLRILLRHGLPNALRPALLACVLGTGATMLLESSLSLLGLGNSDTIVRSWGSLFVSARQNPADWWVGLPPTLILTFTLLSLHTLVDVFSDRQQ